MSVNNPGIRQLFGYHTVAVLGHNGTVRDQGHAMNLMDLNVFEEQFRQNYWTSEAFYRSDLPKLKGEYLLMDAFCCARVVFSSDLLSSLEYQSRHPDDKAGDGGITGMARKLFEATVSLRGLGQDFAKLERRLSVEGRPLVLIAQAMEDLQRRTEMLRQQLGMLSSEMDSFEMGDRCAANNLCRRLILSLTALHRKTCHVANWQFMNHDYGYVTAHVA